MLHQRPRSIFLLYHGGNGKEFGRIILDGYQCNAMCMHGGVRKTKRKPKIKEKKTGLATYLRRAAGKVMGLFVAKVC